MSTRNALMFFVLIGLAFLHPDSPVEADEPETGTHELSGPVKLLWEARYDGPASSLDAANAITVSPDGSTVFVAGISRARPDPDCTVIAYDSATGGQTWIAHYDGPASDIDSCRCVAVSPDGSTVFAAGITTGDGFDWDYVTIAHDAATGVPIWIRRYDGPASRDDGIASAAVSPDGSTVFVTGESSDGPNWHYDYATIAYDAATGEQAWIERYDASGFFHDQATSLVVSPDGSTVFVTGGSEGYPTIVDYATIAYDAATGEQIWIARYDGPASGVDFAHSLAVSPDGSRIFVTGSSASGPWPAQDYTTIAYDAATGEQIWITRYDGPASLDDGIASAAVSPGGSRIFVTGSSASGPWPVQDYATVAYRTGLMVEIDIKPHSINPGNRGVVAVAILGSEDFSVSDVDVARLRFGPNEAACKHDLTDTFTYSEHLKDMNLDGHMDLMTHFETQDTGIGCGDQTATLTGSSVSGQPIEGSDSIRTVGCRSMPFRASNQRTVTVQNVPGGGRRDAPIGARDDY